MVVKVRSILWEYKVVICDPLSENPAHPAFMKIEIRPEICTPMCNYAAVKMEAIGCLVPELRSEKHHGHGTQLFNKTHCFYVATRLRILLCYVKLTCSCKKAA